MKEKRLIRGFHAVLLTILFFGSSYGQEFTNWKNFTDKKNIRSAGLVNDNVWAATTGGLFLYTAADSGFFALNKADGLSGSSLNALAIDAYGKIWMGGLDGMIEIYTPSAGTTKKIYNILNSEFTNKKINSLFIKGDTVFVATEFGLSLINAKTYSFFDTFSKFAALNANIKVSGSFKDSLIYAASDFGIIAQIPGTTNLSAPSSWEVIGTTGGLSSNTVYKIRSFEGNLIASGLRGFSRRNGSAWSIFLPEFNNSSITDFFVTGDSLFIVTGNQIYLHRNGSTNLLYTNTSGNLTGIAGIYNNELFLATDSGLLRLKNSAAVSGIYPPGPGANQFVDLSFDNTGKLWVATGRDITGKGLYTFDGDTWGSITTTTHPVLVTNAYFNVTSVNDKIYAGNWGSGFLRIDGSGNYQIFNANNTPLRGININPEYLVIAGIKADSRGNLWVLNHDASNRKILNVLTPDSTWHQYANYTDSSLVQYMSLLIDRNDTKWFITVDPARSGLYFFNENRTFGTTTDDKSGYASSISDLSGKSINAMALDKKGEIWLGTNLGCYVISNPSSVLNSTPTLRVNSLFSLRQYTITSIAVDPINRKWIGTNNSGVLVMSPDGTTLIASFNTSNSPLLSNQIQSITVEEKTGTVYIGTDAGLTSVNTNAASPERDFGSLRTYPSPFIVHESAHITIDGLIQDSDIKIINLSGDLVAEFSSPGGRVAQWNGRDTNGNIVPTGIYILSAFDKEGNTVSSVKIAVVRK